MAGRFNGCQAIISRDYPLALFFHCVAHCANLASESTANVCIMIRDSSSNMDELGVLYKHSGKYKTMFESACNVYDSPKTIKPICPTRWLRRVRSMASVIDQYEAVLSSLENLSTTGCGATATKATGLLSSFRNTVTILGLQSAIRIFGPLEELNRSLQSSSVTLSGLLQAVESVKTALRSLRTDDAFHEIVEEVRSICERHEIDPLALPRMRQPPRRLTGSGLSGAVHASQTTEEYYHAQFFSPLYN